MKILYAADIHASPGHLDALLKIAGRADIETIVIGGDIIPHYLPGAYGVNVLAAQHKYLQDTLIPAFRNFKRKRDIPVFLDLGNDDFIHARKRLEPLDGDLFHLLHMRVVPLSSDMDIIGYMNVPPTPFGRKDWEKPDSAAHPFVPGNDIIINGYLSESGLLERHTLDLASADTIESDLLKLSEKIEKPFVFVSHSPPYNTPLDVIMDGRHVGSISIGNFIKEWAGKGKLIASLHGHIHESPHRSGLTRTEIGNAVCINPGQNAGRSAELRYAVVDIGIQRDTNENGESFWVRTE